jgi:hypothetical protein
MALGALLCAAALAVAGMAPATADDYPLDGGPDTGVHTFCFDPNYPMAAAVVERARYSMDNNDGVEAQTRVDTADYGTSCGPAIDVRFQQRYLGGDTAGYSPCANRLSNGRCGRRNVQIDWNAIKATYANDGYAVRMTLVHEIGHSLGARHYGSVAANPDGPLAPMSAMYDLINDSGAAWTRRYGPHHINHVHAWFF